MLVTATPCAIKGAAFDCLRDAIERRETYREKDQRLWTERRFPCSRQTPECSRPGDRPSVYRRFFVSGYLPSSTLHHRLCSGCKHQQHRAPESLNRNPFYLTYVVLCVFARVCAYARLSCSLSFASLTCFPWSQTLRAIRSSSLLVSWFLGRRPSWSCPTSTHPRG